MWISIIATIVICVIVAKRSSFRNSVIFWAPRPETALFLGLQIRKASVSTVGIAGMM